MKKKKDGVRGPKARQILGAARQFTYPKEFRIGAATWPTDLVSAAKPSREPSTPEPSKSRPVDSREHDQFLAGLGTGLWRLRRQMLDPGTNQPLEPMKRAYRHLEATWDVVTQAGIEIRDHTGDRMPQGGVYGLKAVAFQPTPGMTREHVIETIKPSIRYRGRLVQMGEVIVGTPPRDGDAVGPVTPSGVGDSS